MDRRDMGGGRMWIKFLTAGGLFVCLLAGTAVADPDPLQAALDKAKAGYKEDVEKATTVLGEKFDERIKKTAESGNLDTVLQLRAEKKAFEEYDIPPKSVLMKTAFGEYQGSTKAARKKLAETYETTIKEYTKKLDTDKAEEVRAEYQLFKSRPVRSVYPSIAGVWQEGPEENKIRVTIVQEGEKFTANTIYQHPQAGEVRWVMTGTILKDGTIKGNLTHTKGPPTNGAQVRTAMLSADGDTITGKAVFAKGGGHDFIWKRLAKKPAEKQ